MRNKKKTIGQLMMAVARKLGLIAPTKKRQIPEILPIGTKAYFFVSQLLPAVVFLPDTKLPEKEYEDKPESVEVGVMIEGEHFTAYYNYDDEYWWVHFGGITVGHRKLDDYDVEGWYYLVKK